MTKEGICYDNHRYSTSTHETRTSSFVPAAMAWFPLAYCLGARVILRISRQRQFHNFSRDSVSYMWYRVFLGFRWIDLKACETTNPNASCLCGALAIPEPPAIDPSPAGNVSR